MSRPRLLDLFCGAGGAAMGYHRAGFDVVGVDIEPHRDYPFPMVAMDAMDALAGAVKLDSFDAIHASPPCQAYSVLRVLNDKKHLELVAPVREALRRWGGPYVIENVPGAPLLNPVRLCGTEFGLTTRTDQHGQVWLKRHRLFESNVWLWGAGGCNCYGKLTVPVYGGGAGGNRVNMRGPGVAQAGREVMQIDWMTRDDLDQAIPPAYTQYIGEQLLAHLAVAA